MVTRTRYKVLAFCVVLAAITYLDRICISIAAPRIRQDLGLSAVQMGWVFAAFQFAYGVFEIPTGHWGDKIGTRRVLTRIVAWWSGFTMITAAAFNYPSLLAIRFLFGIGEAGAWPNVARTFSRWFPLRERATAQGIFFMGAHLAGGLTPLLVTWMLQFFDWRTLFLIFGSIGFVWAVGWFAWVRDEPAEHRGVSPAELAEIEQGRLVQAKHDLTWSRWKVVLRNPSVLGLCGMYLTQSYGFAFYIYWLPEYLRSARGFQDAQALPWLSGLPLIFSVAADLFGGITADKLSQRFGVRRGRVMVGFGSLLLAGIFLISGVWVDDNYLCAVLIGLSGAMGAFLLGAAWATCLDIGGNHAGVVSAVMNTAGQVGAFLSPLVIPYSMRALGSMTVGAYIVGALYLGGALCWLAVNPTKPIWPADEPSPAEAA
ncbi:MAG: MFS transporter [Acidobacteria bacterium]|nr:MFS transporter [Acidobacteriota bacterium]